MRFNVIVCDYSIGIKNYTGKHSEQQPDLLTGIRKSQALYQEVTLRMV